MSIYEAPISLPKQTSSLCPECFIPIPATIYERDKQVWMRKVCPQHGPFDELYWSDAEMYYRAARFSYTGSGVENPQLELHKECPLECGLCDVHQTSTCLANVDVTNRCNLRCEWCFANAHARGYVYEPSIEQITEMLRTLRQERPVPTLAVQFSGGEPTLRDDLPEIIRAAVDLGFAQTQIATNGIKLGRDETLAARLRGVGLSTVYLQFNGVSKATDGFIELKKKAIEHCRQAGQGIVLVPTIGRGLNDHEIGEIIRFAARNVDVIRGVNFQPMAFTGAANELGPTARNAQRFTLPDLAQNAQDQTDGQIRADDFYAVPCVISISKLIEAYTGHPQIEFSTHPHCGIATYLFVEDGKLVPINRFVDVDRFFELTQKLADRLNRRSILRKPTALMQGLLALNSLIREEEQPKSVHFKEMIKRVLVTHDYKALGDFHKTALFIGGMHFMDAYNYDIDRVRRCAIHYAVPGGLIIPFCAYNSGPSYRELIEKNYSIPLDEWERTRGKLTIEPAT
ncbi:MAG: tetraether lipid synthase Tes [Halobacteriota archaeon]